jgi:hypothetical protein
MDGTDLLPPSTPVFAQVPHVTAARARWMQTQAAAMVARLREGAASREAGGLMTKRWGNLLNTVKRGATELADGEVFVALTGLQTTPRIVPQLVVGIQTGGHGPQVRPWLDQLKSLLKHDFPAANFSDQQYARTEYQSWRLEPGLEICAATLGDRLVLTLCPEPMMEVIDRYRDGSRPTLAGNGAFRAARVRLPEQADWLWIAQTEPLIQTLNPFLQWMPQLQALAQPLVPLDAIGAAQVFDGGQVRDVLMVAHKAPPHQLRHAFKSAMLERLPASCVTGMMADVSAGDLYSLVKQVILGVGNHDWLEAQTRFEGRWAAQQADFARDVLGALDTPTAVALDWPAGQRKLAVLFGAPLREPDRVTAILRRFDGAQPPPIRWRIIHGWLWLSFSEEALEHVNRTANGSAPPFQVSTPGQASPAAGSGWMWFFADPARFAMVPGNPAATPPWVTVTTRQGRFDETSAVSPLGSIVSAWLAADAANRQPATKQ